MQSTVDITSMLYGINSLKFETTKPLKEVEEEELASLSQKPSSLQTTTESISLVNIDHFENEEIALLHNGVELNDIGFVKTACFLLFVPKSPLNLKVLALHNNFVKRP